jgi:DNA-directed RNA polymerase specialized sigma24 family protein
MAGPVPLDASTLARPPAEVLDAVARSEVRPTLRRLGVPSSLADDVVQETVATAYQIIHHDNVTLPLPEDGESPLSRIKAFLFGIGRRKASHLLRRAHFRYETPGGLAADLPLSDPHPGAPSAEWSASSRQRLAILLVLVDRLPADFAEVFVMQALFQMKPSEIAGALGVNENTVRSRFQRACSRLRDDIRNLPAEKRRLLEGSPLAALFFWERSSTPEEAEPSRRPGLREIAFVLACGLGFAGGRAAMVKDMAPPASAVAVNEHAPTAVEPALPAAPAPAASMATLPAASTAPPAKASNAAPKPLSDDDTLARELVWIRAAQDALDKRNYRRALTVLDTHARLFPAGKLTAERERRRAEARAGLRPLR